jgi:hypothetical protein
MSPNDFMPIRQAAKHIHRNRLFVRELVDRGIVRAITKGAKDHPWLYVHLADLEQASI